MEYEQVSVPVLTTTILFLFMVLWKWINSRTKEKFFTKLPPGPKKLPIIGNLHQLAGYLPHHRFRDLAKKYGPIMHLQLGEISNVIITSPELAQEVLKTHDLTCAYRPFNLAASIVAYDSKDIAFSPYSDYFKLLKKIAMEELLSAKRVQSLRLLREVEVSNLVRSINSSIGSTINLSKLLLNSANSITFKSAFGRLSKHEDAFSPLMSRTMKYLGGFSVADVFPSVKFLFAVSGMKHKLTTLHQETDNILETITNEHRARKTTASYNGETYLIDVLLDLKDRGNLDFPFTKDNIKAVILDMFLAGTETTSTVVEWVMSELLRNPRLMEKAQAEVRQIYRGKESIDESSAQELKYLKLVIKETLRLHAPAPLLGPREAQEQVEINGYVIPAKSTILINAWAIARDARYWEKPEVFYPERFLNSPIDYKGTNYEYLPFGGGRRMCPGSTQGMAVVELVLANLLYHFDWKLPHGIKPEDLDMSEEFGLIVGRKTPLYAIPISFIST